MLIVLFHVLSVSKCVLYYCRRVSTQLQLTNISYHIISYHIIHHIIMSYIMSCPLVSYRIISHIYHIISYHISYHIIYRILSYHIISYIVSYHIQRSKKKQDKRTNVSLTDATVPVQQKARSNWPPIWWVAANILNEQLRTADKGWSSSSGVGRVDNSSP